jgi:1,4-dihydroxy-2-naphthoyl-CoA hydrolase
VSEADIRPLGFTDHIGVEWGEMDPDGARARIKVEDHHLQPFGVVHGGVYASLGEAVCSAATWHALREDDVVPLGQNNNTTFLQPIAEGHVNALATARQRGRITWIWDVEMSDDDGKVCALCRMTIAVRPARNGSP